GVLSLRFAAQLVVQTRLSFQRSLRRGPPTTGSPRILFRGHRARAESPRRQPRIPSSNSASADTPRAQLTHPAELGTRETSPSPPLPLPPVPHPPPPRPHPLARKHGRARPRVHAHRELGRSGLSNALHRRGV